MENLSVRLKTIAESVPANAKVCDVGTDHGFLPIYLASSGRAVSVIATDINEKPLKKAEENIKKSGVCGISLRLCDGLSGVDKGEVDTVIAAGMGGEVISGILFRGGEIVKNGDVALILQPTTSPEFLRKYLCENGFSILREIPVEENGKLYSVMSCRFTDEKQSKPNWFYFSGLVDPKDRVGKKYLLKQRNRAEKCMKALEKIESKQKAYNYYKEIFDNLWHLTVDF